MTIPPAMSNVANMPTIATPASKPNLQHSGSDDEVRQTFQQVMGEMLFGQMLKAMRKTVNKSEYFNGGRAEEVFTQQLDQTIAKKMSSTSADRFTGPMYELWTMQGRR